MKTCIIMGNGESLNDLDQRELTMLDSFGVNYAKYQPTYYVCIDGEILTLYHRKIYDLAKNAQTAYLAQKNAGTSNLYDLPNVELITHDRDAFHLEHYFSGLTVTYVALKIAYYMGFEEVHLWGVDHSTDWAHYKKDYPPGSIDRRPWRMGEMEYHYQLAQDVYAKANRRIINHSYPSKLDAIFPRVGKE